MAQLNLFDSGTQSLLEDETGSIILVADLVDAATCREWFSELQRQVPWRAGRRKMYERDVEVPRLRANYHLDAPDLPAPVAAARAAIAKTNNAPFNSVGLNLYRNEHDSVAPHNDTLSELVRGEPIALLSLGATRPMTIRAKAPPPRVLKVELEAGSLLIMSWDTQLHYDHAIQKLREPTAPRISLAFRVHKMQAT